MSALPARDALTESAEIERLARELASARERIADLEARIDNDPLTGIMNRRGFERELRRSMSYIRRYGGSAALIYLDLDRFKAVNDRHGHVIGDALLKAVAERIARRVRGSDSVARLGGDEFAVLIWNVEPSHALIKALELEEAVADVTVSQGGKTLATGASAGLAMIDAEKSPDDNVAAADAAMYARKKERAKT